MPNLANPFNANVLRRAARILTNDGGAEVLFNEADSSAAQVAAEPTPVSPSRRTRKKPVQSIAPEDFVGPLLPVGVEPLREVTHSDKTPLGYTIGIELTAMPDLTAGERSSFGDSAASYLARLVRDLLRYKKQKTNDVDRDVKAVEVSSEPLKTWGEAKKFYDTVTDAFSRFGLKSHVEDTISGGGHIHVGGMSTKDMVNTMRDIQNRPYLNWIFNDPDDQTTHSYAKDLQDIDSKMKKLAPEVNMEMLRAFGRLESTGKSALLFYGKNEGVSPEWLPNDKRRMVRLKHHGYNDDDVKEYTFEFRFLQTPLDWKEQQAHLEFVLRYINWVKETYKDKDAVVTVDTTAKVKAFTEERSVLEFRALLKELKLPEEPYARMLLENLPVWFERGSRL
jgi:hypothetical protein